MRDPASLDLKVRDGVGTQPGEQRIELRVASTGDFVAWFQTNRRMSGGYEVVGTNTQIVYLTKLSAEQVTAVEEWLREQFLASLQTKRP